MGKRRQFTNEFKLEAVKLAEEGTVSVAPVARELDRRQTILRREAQRFVSTRVGDQIGSILSDYYSRPVGMAPPRRNGRPSWADYGETSMGRSGSTFGFLPPRFQGREAIMQ